MFQSFNSHLSEVVSAAAAPPPKKRQKKRGKFTARFTRVSKKELGHGKTISLM
jgi:hypothetical protein